jgi:hypothetical protein
MDRAKLIIETDLTEEEKAELPQKTFARFLHSYYNLKQGITTFHPHL